MIGLIVLATGALYVTLLIILIGTALTGLIGGTVLAVVGRALNKSENRKTIAKVLTIFAVIFLVVGVAAAGVFVYLFFIY